MSELRSDWTAKKETTVAMEQSPANPLELKNILCPVDFSEFSRRAFRYAVALTTRFGSHLFLLHTVEPGHYSLEGSEAEGLGGPGQYKPLHSSREALQRMLISSSVDSSKVTMLLNSGDVSARVREAVAKESIDLVVMGTHGRRGFKVLVGSVTEGIIHRCTCPVLAISHPEKEIAPSTMEDLELRTILLATDFSPRSDCAMAYAIQWAGAWGARVIMLNVVRESFPGRRSSSGLQFAAAWERIRPAMEQAVPRCEVAVEECQGNPKEEILRITEQTGADLVITGARRASGAAVSWDPVSSAVVRNGRCPVLVVGERF